jgi:lipid-A-disaccharide synthase
MLIFISAGEPSGDLHASNLVRALRKVMPDAEFAGFGGPRLARAGATLLYPLVDLAVMWFAQVFRNIATFARLLKQADRYFAEHKPDAVVLIDFPGFHWLLAKRARRRGIPVIYYVPPQLWAWAGWRVRKVKKYVDLMLCSLPFEPAWYAARGYEAAEHVGHPYFDELAARSLDMDFLADQQQHVGPVVAILPGSRTQELVRNLPAMLRAAARVAAERSDVRFVAACLHERHAALVRGTAERLHREASHGGAASIDPERLTVFAGRTPELIRLADVAWAVSGSVGLELMHETLPTVVLYTVRRFDLAIARPFIKARFISLVNLLAGAAVMPEYLVDRDASGDLAAWALRWLNDPAERGAAVERLVALKERVAQPGASERAARRIAEHLDYRPRPSIYRGPHDPRRSRRLGPGTAESGEFA